MRPKKRSMLVRFPNSSAVQVGGRPSRRFWRFGFQGITTWAPRTVWIQAISRRPPVAGSELYHARPQREQPHPQFQQGACEGGIVDIGGREAEEHGHAGAAAQHGMQAVAAQERARMVGWGMAERGIGIGSGPGQGGSAVGGGGTGGEP